MAMWNCRIFNQMPAEKEMLGGWVTEMHMFDDHADAQAGEVSANDQPLIKIDYGKNITL